MAPPIETPGTASKPAESLPNISDDLPITLWSNSEPAAFLPGQADGLPPMTVTDSSQGITGNSADASQPQITFQDPVLQQAYMLAQQENLYQFGNAATQLDGTSVSLPPALSDGSTAMQPDNNAGTSVDTSTTAAATAQDTAVTPVDASTTATATAQDASVTPADNTSSTTPGTNTTPVDTSVRPSPSTVRPNCNTNRGGGMFGGMGNMLPGLLGIGLMSMLFRGGGFGGGGMGGLLGMAYLLPMITRMFGGGGLFGGGGNSYNNGGYYNNASSGYRPYGPLNPFTPGPYNS